MTTDNEDTTPNERAQHLLRVLIERYIRDGQPVGSRTLSKESGLDLSSATIRNVMSDLEEIGFLVSPHTSAGRVPTAKGFRFFVDTLLRLQPVGRTELQELRKQIGGEISDSQSLAATTSNLLSSLTRLAGLVTLPKDAHCTLRQLEFLPLSERRILAIMVVNSHEVQNRVLHVDRDYDAEELVRAGNYLNEKFAGLELDEVRRRLLEELRQTREDMNRLMLDAISMAQRALEEDQKAELEYVLAGETNLMGLQELSDVDKLRQLFKVFNEKRDLLRLLDRTVSAQGVQIFIGEESEYNVFGECSVVAAPYTRDGKVVGVLGVIGPTRMPYERVIPVVDITSRLVSSALKSRSQTP
ncbi:MAG: heat-inducible transcriptional repressor HrcA [Gammaproteobacteria bacterium]|jgi:heat-inducible transcriptional repressor